MSSPRKDLNSCAISVLPYDKKCKYAFYVAGNWFSMWSITKYDSATDTLQINL